MIALPHEDALPEPRAGADDGARAVRLRPPFLQRHQILRAQRLDAVADGLEVVDEPDLGNFELARERSAVHFPREIGDLGELAGSRPLDRPGDAEARRVHASQRIATDGGNECA